LASENLVISPSEDELVEAWAQYSSERYGTASVIDIASFIVMRRLGITQAFTNDQHLKAAGFITLF
jgi:predicted nucleic acid-binding protein